MRQVTNGDTVRVHYRGTLDDGSEFDSSAGRGPIELTVGGGQVIPGFEDALMGMAEGETKNVTLPPEEAYGHPDPALIHVVNRDRIPGEIALEVGTVLQAADASGHTVRLTVVEVGDSDVTLDANHPLVGKALTFELELVAFV